MTNEELDEHDAKVREKVKKVIENYEKFLATGEIADDENIVSKTQKGTLEGVLAFSDLESGDKTDKEKQVATTPSPAILIVSASVDISRN